MNKDNSLVIMRNNPFIRDAPDFESMPSNNASSHVGKDSYDHYQYSGTSNSNSMAHKYPRKQEQEQIKYYNFTSKDSASNTTNANIPPLLDMSNIRIDGGRDGGGVGSRQNYNGTHPFHRPVIHHQQHQLSPSQHHVPQDCSTISKLKVSSKHVRRRSEGVTKECSKTAVATTAMIPGSIMQRTVHLPPIPSSTTFAGTSSINYINQSRDHPLLSTNSSRRFIAAQLPPRQGDLNLHRRRKTADSLPSVQLSSNSYSPETVSSPLPSPVTSAKCTTSSKVAARATCGEEMLLLSTSDKNRPQNLSRRSKSDSYTILLNNELLYGECKNKNYSHQRSWSDNNSCMNVSTAAKSRRSFFGKDVLKTIDSNNSLHNSNEAIKNISSGMHAHDSFARRAVRTTEFEPAVHQMSIPSASELLVHARICSLLENYANLMCMAKQEQQQKKLQFQKKHKKTKNIVCDVSTTMFDFRILTRMSRMEMEGMLRGTSRTNHWNGDDNTCVDEHFLDDHSTFESKPPAQSLLHQQESGSIPNKIKEQPCHAKTRISSSLKPCTHQNPPHPSIVKSLIECGDDVTVEGFFRGQTKMEIGGSGVAAVGDGVEVAILSSQKLRQLFVCFRGCLEDQARPVQKNVKQIEKNSGATSYLHPDQQLPVHPIFRDAYFSNNLEDKIFKALERLSIRQDDPFGFSITMTGHSFGAALATLCATRYASVQPMMQVSCHAFGSPRVGGIQFRRFANSLPNLKMIRLEYGHDTFVNMPDSGSFWCHVGHTITISADVANLDTHQQYKNSIGMEKTMKLNGGSSTLQKISNRSSMIPSSLRSGNKKNDDHYSQYIRAYRFDERRGIFLSGKKVGTAGLGKKSYRRKGARQLNHEVRSYVHAIEKFTHEGLPWVTSFVGDTTTDYFKTGISKKNTCAGSAIDHEDRCVV